MIIACDVDGVVADLQSEWLRRYNKDYEDTLTLEDWTTFGVHEKCKCGTKLYEYLHDPTLYPAVLPVHNALYGVNLLRTLGHRVVFVTSCVPGMTDGKYDWLVENKFLAPSNDGWWGGLSDDFIVTGDKSLIDADILIEDRAETVIEWVEKRRHRAIIINRPWNRGVDMRSSLTAWITWVDDWREVVEHV